MPVPNQMLVSVLRRLAWAACTLLPSGASGAVDRSMRLSRQRRNDDTLLLRRAPGPGAALRPAPGAPGEHDPPKEEPQQKSVGSY